MLWHWRWILCFCLREIGKLSYELLIVCCFQLLSLSRVCVNGESDEFTWNIQCFCDVQASQTKAHWDGKISWFDSSLIWRLNLNDMHTHTHLDDEGYDISYRSNIKSSSHKCSFTFESLSESNGKKICFEMVLRKLVEEFVELRDV